MTAATGEADPAAGHVTITIVHAPACHFCADAMEALAELSGRYPIQVHAVDLRSPEGLRLVGVHRPGMNPLVLLDGAFFSAGRLPRGKLRKALEWRAAAAERVG